MSDATSLDVGAGVRSAVTAGGLVLAALICGVRAPAAHAQAVVVAAAAGPVFLPGADRSADWHGLVAVGLQGQHAGGRLEAMYTGVPGADLLAATASLVWQLRRPGVSAVEPYLIVGIGRYQKFSDGRFGLNGGAGVRRALGPVHVFVELRYHRVTRRFAEASEANAFVPVSLGLTLTG